MKLISKVEFRYRMTESQLTCIDCETPITNMTRSSDAELFSTDTGVALKVLVAFPGTFSETDGKLLCHACHKRRRACKPLPQTDIAKDLEGLESKLKEKFKHSDDPDELSRWKQAQEILQTLHHLVEGA